MRSFAEIEQRIDAVGRRRSGAAAAAELLGLGEEILEHWVVARGDVPTRERREGFRLLALHRQGASGEPSFNACRETCRELAYHYNLITTASADHDVSRDLHMMAMVATHLLLFVAGKLEVAELGDFCCSARPVHASSR